jgi:hypothetical protein
MPRTEQSPLLSKEVQCRHGRRGGGGRSVCMTNAGTGRTQMGGGSTEHVYSCSGGVVVVALRDLVACEFSVRRPRGGRSVVLLSSFHPQFDDSNTSTRFVP